VILFVSPHNDDAVLFGSFRIQEKRPLVLTVFDSHLQVQRGHPECSAVARRREDIEAINLLGCNIAFSGISDALPIADQRPLVDRALRHWNPAEVWLPAVEDGGHEQHNLVGEVGLQVFQYAKVHRYLTYRRGVGRSTNGRPVMPTGKMVMAKLQALACYRTQIEIDRLGCWPHFLRLDEFEAF
jgi:LmbE family N-acetylglucosaminyl deacetylase